MHFQPRACAQSPQESCSKCHSADPTLCSTTAEIRAHCNSTDAHHTWLRIWEEGSPDLRLGRDRKGRLMAPLTCDGSELLQDRARPPAGIPKHYFCFPLKLGQDMGTAEQGPDSGHRHPSEEGRTRCGLEGSPAKSRVCGEEAASALRRGPANPTPYFSPSVRMQRTSSLCPSAHQRFGYLNSEIFMSEISVTLMAQRVAPSPTRWKLFRSWMRRPESSRNPCRMDLSCKSEEGQQMGSPGTAKTPRPEGVTGPRQQPPA